MRFKVALSCKSNYRTPRAIMREAVTLTLQEKQVVPMSGFPERDPFIKINRDAVGVPGAAHAVLETLIIPTGESRKKRKDE